MCCGAEGDHAAVPQGAVELGEAGFGVFAAAVEGLVDGGVVGDLEEMFGAVEAGLGAALACLAFSGGGGDADGFAVFVGAAGAEDGEQVVPAVGVGAGAAFGFADGQGDEGAVVEEGPFVNTAALGPQFVAATAVGHSSRGGLEAYGHPHSARPRRPHGTRSSHHPLRRHVVGISAGGVCAGGSRRHERCQSRAADQPQGGASLRGLITCFAGRRGRRHGMARAATGCRAWVHTQIRGGGGRAWERPHRAFSCVRSGQRRPSVSSCSSPTGSGRRSSPGSSL